MDYIGSYLYISFFISCIIRVVDVQSITTKPRNTAALNNTQVTLQCVFSTSTNYAKWREYITGTGTGQVPISGGVSINPSHPRADRYRMDANDAAGKYNLQIKALVPDDSGYYACIGDQLENAKYGAYVVYLGPRTCGVSQGGTAVTNNIVVENDDFTLTCQRDYRSFTGWPPIMEWSGPPPISITRNITNTANIRYEVDLRAQEGMDGNTYRCRTSFTSPPLFKPPNEGFQDDTTTPTISEADCEATIQVHWPAKNIVRSPEKQTYYPRDSVECSASVNPAPATYRWVKLSGNGPEESAGATLSITEAMLGDSMYECIVTNKVRGVDTNNSRNFTFRVIPTPTTVIPTTWTPVQTTTPLVTGPGVTKSQPLKGGGLSGGAIAGIVIGCLVGVAVIIALIICCLMRSKKEEDTKPMSLQKTQKAGNGVDQVRGGPYMPTDLAYTNNADNRSPTGTGPPPYDPRYPNQPDGGLQYADLQFNSSVDDTPRSRKPIQMSDPGNATVYADIRRV